MRNPLTNKLNIQKISIILFSFRIWFLYNPLTTLTLSRLLYFLFHPLNDLWNPAWLTSWPFRRLHTIYFTPFRLLWSFDHLNIQTTSILLISSLILFLNLCNPLTSWTFRRLLYNLFHPYVILKPFNPLISWIFIRLLCYFLLHPLYYFYNPLKIQTVFILLLAFIHYIIFTTVQHIISWPIL